MAWGSNSGIILCAVAHAVVQGEVKGAMKGESGVSREERAAPGVARGQDAGSAGGASSDGGGPEGAARKTRGGRQPHIAERGKPVSGRRK